MQGGISFLQKTFLDSVVHLGFYYDSFAKLN